jgi:hypothetical protein
MIAVQNTRFDEKPLAQLHWTSVDLGQVSKRRSWLVMISTDF